MKYRVALWGSVGFLVAVGWAFYFAMANKDLPIKPLVYTLARLTCPVALIGWYFPVSVYWSFVANAATYALVGLVIEMLRPKLHHPR